MSLTTYAGLQAFVAGLLHRTDLTAVIPDLIVLAEAQMNRRLRVRQMVARATAEISDPYSALPTDFLAERTMTLSTSPPAELTFYTQDALDQRSAGYASDHTSQPTAYSVVGGEFRFWPAPDATYDATLTYFCKIPALSDSNTANWLLTAYPDAYVYGTALQAAPYLRSDERLPMWTEMFATILADIQKTHGERKGRTLSVDPALQPRCDLSTTGGYWLGP